MENISTDVTRDFIHKHFCPSGLGCRSSWDFEELDSQKNQDNFLFFLNHKKRSKPLKPYLSVDISECASSVNAESKLTQLPIVLCHESLAFLARSLATQVEIPPETETETEKQRDERKNWRGKSENLRW
jgi:hypothetical protein